MSTSHTHGSLLAHQCILSPRSDNPVCKISGLKAIRLARPNIAEAVRFFEDFGLSSVYADTNLALLRGTHDTTPCMVIERGPARYIGFSLAVDNATDLQKLAAAHAVPVLDNHPLRGGQCVLLRDPDNLMIEVMHGWTALPAMPAMSSSPSNRPENSTRINQTVRINLDQPPQIFRLGHTVIGVTRFADSLDWYQRNFGLIVSDFQMMENDPLPVVAFLRCDRGATPTDHHTIALGSAVEIGHLHSAFELPDMDAVVAAGEILRRRHYHHTWGVGRHILGSQIFDYWRDPEGDMFEHYADGDLFDAGVATGYHAFGSHTLHQWGPALNADMAGKTPSLHLAQTVISRLRSKDDLSLRRLFNLVKSSS